MAENGGRFGRLIEMLILQSLALDALEQSETAGQALVRAISLARPAGYVRVFLDCGQLMHELLAWLLKQDVIEAPMDEAYVKTILDAFQAELGVDDAVSALPDLLTEREIEVLRVLAEGASNKEIAERLIVAPSTIKQHLKSIYSKLDVHNRTQAVERGREIGLLYNAHHR